MKSIHISTKQLVENARTQRKLLQKFSPYLTIPMKQWNVKNPIISQSGLKVYHHEGNGDITLGVGNLPRLDRRVIVGPKGFRHLVNSTDSQAIFDKQRLGHVREFDEAISSNTPYGVLLTGPNGIGKSSIIFTTFLTCFTRSFPSIYIPSADKWIEYSGYENFTERRAEEYFMKTFFSQNADLIIEDERYSMMIPFFLDQIDGNPIGSNSFQDFCKAACESKVPQVCVFIDEFQHISEAAASDDRRTSFFKMFTRWTESFGGFQSQLCATDHGLHDFNFPYAEKQRLRYVYPTDANEMHVLISTPGNPFYNPSLLKETKVIIDESGCVLRPALDLINAVPRDIQPDNHTLIQHYITHAAKEMEIEMYNRIEKKWWKSMALTDNKKLILLGKVWEVLSGTATLEPDIKGLFDYGLITRIPGSAYVRTISDIARDALNKFYSAQYKLVTSSVLEAENAGGFGLDNFKSQIYSSLVGMTGEIFLKGSLLKNKDKIIPLRVDAGKVEFYDNRVSSLQSEESTMQGFHGEKESRSRYKIKEKKIKEELSFQQSLKQILHKIKIDDNMRILWIPLNTSDLVHCILMPAAISKDPIIIIDASITSPNTTERRMKAVKIGRFAALLADKFQRSVFGAIFYNQSESSLTEVVKEKNISSLPSNVYLVDGDQMKRLGVKLE